MTKETDDAINLVAQHFLLDEAKPLADVTDALAAISGGKPFEALGRAMFSAMIKTTLPTWKVSRLRLSPRSRAGAFTNGNAR